MPMIKVITVGNLFVLRGDDGMMYGSYPTRKLADERCADWNFYYNDVVTLAKKTKS